MKGKFFDTSILVHAFFVDDSKKHKIAKDFVKRVFEGKEDGIVSNQVLSELFFVLVKKKGIDKEIAEKIIDSFILSRNWKKVSYTFSTIEKAKKIVRKYDIPFWDSLIIATLLENKIRIILTENVKDFKKIEEIEVINPFE